MTTKSAPKEGEIVYIQGFEFVATNIRITDAQNHPHKPGQKCCRFTGIATDSSRNNSIRNTSYNGGTYGWNI